MQQTSFGSCLFACGLALANSIGCSENPAPVQPGSTATSGTSTTTGQATATSAGPSTTGGTVTGTATSNSGVATVTSGATLTSGATATGGTTTGTTGATTAGTTGGTCLTGQLDCTGVCVDVASDNANCGVCGNDCGPNAQCSGGRCCGQLALPIERAGQYVLEFGNTFFAAQAAGGKILEFRRGDGSNLFTGPAVEATNFGSTVWTAPQSDWGWPPPTAIDSAAYTVTVDEALGSITMVSMGVPNVGPNVVVTKVFKADLCAEAVDIGISVQNNGAAAASLSPWQISRVQPGGLSFFAGAEALLPGDTTKTPLVTQYLSGAHWYDHAANPLHDGKIFGEATGGYVAFTQGSDLFVKSWTDVTAHPPQHGEVEIYDGTGYVELEVVGTYGPVAGTAATLNVRWRVRPMPAGAQRVAGDAALLAAVQALLAE